MHEVSNLIFMENRKIFSKCHLLNFLHSMKSVNLGTLLLKRFENKTKLCKCNFIMIPYLDG